MLKNSFFLVGGLTFILLAWLRPNSPRAFVPPPPGRMYHGVFPGGSDGMGGDIRRDSLEAYQRAVGRPAAWVYFSDNWFEGREFPRVRATWIRQMGSLPYIRLMLLSRSPIEKPDPEFNLANILAGKLDRDLRAWMRGARDFGTPLLAEYGVEVNGFWFPWNGLFNGGGAQGVERFRQAYRHIVQIAREEGANNVRWVFHVDPWDEPVEDWNRLENYYPGDEWIDFTGASVYGRQTPHQRYRPTFREQMDWVYGRLRKMAPSKPVIVCEFGNIREPGQLEWTQAALNDLLAPRWPAVIGFSWWNENFDADGETARSIMTVKDSPGLAPLFRRMLDSPRVLERVAE